MGILGLTHDENGTALEKLPVTIKVAIGEGPEPGNENSHPRRLDHFVFKRKTLRGQDVVWEPAPDISGRRGETDTNWESSSSTMTPGKSSEPNTRCGRQG